MATAQVASLASRIEYLQTEVEVLFNHTFNSIKKDFRPAPIEQREATRTLSTVTQQAKFEFEHHFDYEGHGTIRSLIFPNYVF